MAINVPTAALHLYAVKAFPKCFKNIWVGVSAVSNRGPALKTKMGYYLGLVKGAEDMSLSGRAGSSIITVVNLMSAPARVKSKPNSYI